MKIILVTILLVVSAIAEPPVDNRYLPPQQGLSGGLPSQTYGPPNAAVSHHSQTNAIFRGRPFAPSRPIARRPTTQYGPPAPSAQYGAPQITPSAQYGTPQVAPSAQYGAPQVAPSAQYGAPQVAPSAQYGLPAPSSQYGLPQSGFGRQAAPSQLYGAPGFGTSGALQSTGSNYRAAEQSRQYLPPGAGSRYSGDEGTNEPANYNFEYMVKDDESGNDFGHRESRLGDRAEGLYYVVLPDGRKQTVEYEADQDGYKPRISYEDTGRGAYRNNLGGYQNGYEHSGPY